MTATAVSPTSQRPRHDVTLTDGTTTVGFILTDSQGKPNPRAISDSPQQRTAVKTSSGDNKYSDLVPPWGTFVIDDWSGGRGIRWQDDDKSRFYENVFVETSQSGELTLASAPRVNDYVSDVLSISHDAQPWRKSVEYINNKDSIPTLTWVSNTTYPYIAQSFEVPAAMTGIQSVTFFAELTSTTANDLTVSIYTDVAGSPGVLVDSQAINAYWTKRQDRTAITVDFGTAVTVTAGATYWFVLYTATASWNWGVQSILFSPPDVAQSSSNGTAWSAITGKYMPFRVNDNTLFDAGILLEYKSSLYYITRPKSGNSKLYINGDRGAADSNVGALTTLVDATKSWTTNQYVSCIVKIINGAGSEEEFPFRLIQSNNATTLTVTEAWTIAHDTTTEYVILDSKMWTEVEDLGQKVVCATAAGDFIYTGSGNIGQIKRYQAYNNAGTWTDRIASEDPGGRNFLASKMVTIERNGRTYLYCAVRRYAATEDTYKWSIERFEVPDHWGDLIAKRIVQIAPTDEPWDSDSIANVTQSTTFGATKIAIGAALAISGDTRVALENLDEPVDITQANSIGFYIMSSTAVSANKIKIRMDDTPNLGKTVLPIAMFEASAIGSSATFTDMQDAIDGTGSSYTVTGMTSSEYIYVISDRKFNKVTFDFTATVNNNAATMGFLYFNGSFWVTLPLSSLDTDGTGTSSGGATFAKDGYIAFVPPDDWEKITINDVEGYAIALAPSATLDDVGIFEVTVQRQNLLTCTIAEALVANQWQRIDIAITPTEEPAPNETLIQSIDITTSEDNGAQNIYLKGGIWAIGNNSVIPLDGEKIINLIGYSGNQSGIENCWAFTDIGVYELQGENDDIPVRLPISEFRHITASTGGVAACVNDVYLWFSLGHRIERYYLRNLDDIGPDKDEGLIPVDQNAEPHTLFSYPGRVFLSLDNSHSIGLQNQDAVFSSVLVHRGGGWHNFYRSPAFSSISTIYVQGVPGVPYSWLWAQEDGNLVYIRIANSDYNLLKYCGEGVIETGWIHCGMMDVPKTFGDIKLFAEYQSGCSVTAQYKLDNDTTWTSVTGTFDTSPSEALTLGVTGKRIKIRLRLIGGNAYTPRVFALLLEYFAVIPVKYNYGWTSALKEDFMSIDLRGENELVLGYTSRAETAYAQLRTWANAGTKLTQNSRFSVYDNKTVILNAPASQPIRIDSDEQREEILISVSTFDL